MLRQVARTVLAGILVTATVPTPVAVGQAQSPHPPQIREADAERIADFVRATGSQVLTFVGYSAAEYEDRDAMLAQARRVLDQHDPRTTLVNIGATAEGIGAVYELAKQRGFTTIGIVSQLARQEGVTLSPHVDHVFFVPDDSWGGLRADGKTLAPTSAAIVANSNRMVGIGGSDIARDEMLAAASAGVPVLFIAADMNHAIARRKAREKGQPEPNDFAGSAAMVRGALPKSY